MRKLKISIISISFNCVEQVQKTISSVLSQRFDSFEYIIKDGGSTDGTVSRIESITRDSPIPITFVTESDNGIADAMNIGAALANGELIIHLHMGDYFLTQNVLEEVWSNYTTEKWDWAVGNLLIQSKSERNFKFVPGTKHDLGHKNCIPHQATFIKRELFLLSGGFDINLKQAMDYDLWLRLVGKYMVDFHKLDIDVAFFESNGESTKILELLRYNYAVMKKSEQYGFYGTNIKKATALIRIFLYWCYYKFLTNA